MALVRAPSQYAPVRHGGPVTPSCCGCCCCCCCAGTAVATTIALPLLLHQMTRNAEQRPAADSTRSDQGHQTPAAPSTSMPDPPDWSPVPVGTGRRLLGMVMAALAIPAGFGGLVAAQTLIGNVVDADLLSLVLGLIVMAAFATVGYLVAGVRNPLQVLTPLMVTLVAVLAAALELLWWLAVLIDDPSLPQMIIGVTVVVAIPVLTTVLIILAGRVRRRSAT